MRSLDYGDTPHLLHQMHRTELRVPTNRARLNGMRAGHTEMHDYLSFNIEKQQGCNDSLYYISSLRSKEHYYFTLKNLEKCTIAYHATKCRRVENFRSDSLEKIIVWLFWRSLDNEWHFCKASGTPSLPAITVILAVANTEAHAKKALQALRNPGQTRPLLPLHLRPFLVETFQYSERSSLLSVNNSYKNYVSFSMYRIIMPTFKFDWRFFLLNNILRLLNSEEREKCNIAEVLELIRSVLQVMGNISIFLISPYSIVASQDKAISQNVINTAANHKDIILISDLLQPQELLCRFLDKIRDLCRLQLKDTIIQCCSYLSPY
ncbi:hypothetical protein G5I_02043 [Acromyrmex echinatior]|uniref:Uncharacterized protein n=1 Tax=Acromyrmex echinatior TaxID=103372 RepID=F4W996_ACREC|nr:hypothetical protein G5I_02043 [Acromyrmex echinatior]